MQAETVSNWRCVAKQSESTRAGEQPKPRSILLVGASVRWAAQSANRAGYSVVGMDLFGDTDTRAVCRHFELIRSAVAANAKLLRAAIEDLASRTDSQIEIVGGLASIATERTHAELTAACEGLSIEVPRTLKLNSANSIRDRQSLPATSDASLWLIKSRRSSGGLGVRHWEPRCDAQSRELESDESYLQERIRGRSFGVVAIANGREVRVLGISKSLHQRIGDVPYVYAGSAGPWSWGTGPLGTGINESIPTSDLLTLATRIACDHNVRGLFNLDLIRDQDHRWWLLEVNERPSGSCEVIERAAAASTELGEYPSLMKMHLDARSGHEIVWNDVPPRSIHLKRIVYAKHEGNFQSSRAPKCMADIPSDGTRIVRGEPIGTLLLDSPYPSGTKKISGGEVSDQVMSLSKVAQSMRTAVAQLQASVLTREETDHLRSP